MQRTEVEERKDVEYTCVAIDIKVEGEGNNRKFRKWVSERKKRVKDTCTIHI